RILLEHRDVLRRAAAMYLASNQLAEIGDPVPGCHAAGHRLEKVSLFVHDRLFLESGDNTRGARDHRVVEFAPRSRYRALEEHALVAGDDRRNVLAGL